MKRKPELILPVAENLKGAGMTMGDLKQSVAREVDTAGRGHQSIVANIYLNRFDWKMAQAGYDVVRYSDDFVALCRSKEEAEEASKAHH